MNTPFRTLYHICIVVHDTEKTAAEATGERED